MPVETTEFQFICKQVGLRVRQKRRRGSANCVRRGGKSRKSHKYLKRYLGLEITVTQTVHFLLRSVLF